MKSPVRLIFTLILFSMMAVFFLQDDEPEAIETTSIEQEASPNTEPVVQKDQSTSSFTFLRKSWSKVRKSISSIKMGTTVNAQNQKIQNTATKDASSTSAVSATNNDFSENRQPLTNTEIQSVVEITKAMSKAIALDLTSHQFMKMISDTLKLQPQFLDEGTSSIGSFVTVRTHNSLEGTRYLHAQFTGEKNKADFLQHASFQVRPGPDSFKKAVEALDEVLPKNKKVKETSGDYVLYSSGDGYVAWVKVADMEDLQSNDYNKASPKDVGTIIVTIEQEIHGDEEHSH